MRTSSERAPLALSEAWLWDGGPRRGRGELAEPCEACRFGMSAWMCGHGEMLARSAAANMDYARASREWAARLQERRPPRSVKGPSLDSEIPPAAPGSSAFLGGVAAAETGTLSPAAALLGGSPGTARAPMTEAPMLDLPGAGRHGAGPAARRRCLELARARGRRGGGGERAARQGAGAARFGDFPCDNVEIRELHGEEAISRLSVPRGHRLFRGGRAGHREDAGGRRLSRVRAGEPGGSPRLRHGRGGDGQAGDRVDVAVLQAVDCAAGVAVDARGDAGGLSGHERPGPRRAEARARGGSLARTWRCGSAGRTLRGSSPCNTRRRTSPSLRLAEHLGICFFFEHEGGADKIVFSDDNSGFRPARRRGGGALPAARGEGGHLRARGALAGVPCLFRRAGLQLPHTAGGLDPRLREPAGVRRRRRPEMVRTTRRRRRAPR